MTRGKKKETKMDILEQTVQQLGEQMKLLLEKQGIKMKQTGETSEEMRHSILSAESPERGRPTSSPKDKGSSKRHSSLPPKIVDAFIRKYMEADQMNIGDPAKGKQPFDTESFIDNDHKVEKDKKIDSKPYMYISRRDTLDNRQRLEARRSMSELEYVNCYIKMLLDRDAKFKGNMRQHLQHLENVTADAAKFPWAGVRQRSQEILDKIEKGDMAWEDGTLIQVERVRVRQEIIAEPNEKF